MRDPVPPTPSTDRLRRAVNDAVWPFREAAWSVQEKVLWPVGDVLRRKPGRLARLTDERGTHRSGLFSGGGREALYPIERAWWGVERTVVWPVQDRFVELGQNAQVAAVAAVAATAIAAGAAGFVASGSSNGDAPSLAPVTAVTHVAAPPPRQLDVQLGTPSYPESVQVSSSGTLQGVPPDFGSIATLKPSIDNSGSGSGGGPAASKASAPSLPTNGSVPEEPSAFPSARNTKGAQEVASHFSNAFVSYEVGEQSSAVKEAFRKTATPALAKSLADRPPRLPGEIVVPKAKVLNILIGRPAGKQVEASVSLVRLGSLSELRLVLHRDGKAWRISEVRG